MATYYINADTGNDTTGDGSQGNPWLTLSKANSSSTSGDTIFCQSATNAYVLISLLTLTNKTIIGENRNQVVFTTNGISSSNGYFRAATGSTNTIKNVKFYNIASSGSYNKIFESFGVFNFENCVFDTITADTIMGVSSGTFNVSMCLFYNFSASVFFIRTNAKFNIYNNVFVFENTSSVFITRLDSGGDITNLINNILFSSQLNNISIFTSGVTIGDFNNNCLSGNFTSVPSGFNNLINTDPLFIDPANRNYNLSPSSPCIDAGTLV